MSADENERRASELSARLHRRSADRRKQLLVVIVCVRRVVGVIRVHRMIRVIRVHGMVRIVRVVRVRRAIRVVRIHCGIRVVRIHGHRGAGVVVVVALVFVAFVLAAVVQPSHKLVNASMASRAKVRRIAYPPVAPQGLG